jgi:predicted phage terminase large subunit-like protein
VPGRVDPLGRSWGVCRYCSGTKRFEDRPCRACDETGVLGDALWPGRWGVKELVALKKLMTNYWWTALYQGAPVPPEGNVVRRDYLTQFYEGDPFRLAPAMDAIIGSWDCAFKDLKTSSWVVGQVWGRSGADRYLLDQVRGQWGIIRTKAEVRRMVDRWRPHGLRRVLIEDKANGPAVIEELKNTIPELRGWSTPDGKEARLNAVLPVFEAGRVVLPAPSGTAWVAEYIDELIHFPYAATDDMVDATTQALLHWSDKSKKRLRAWVPGSRPTS